jgi:ABC-2 type transport system permease protein
VVEKFGKAWGRIREDAALFRRYLAVSIRGQMQYRASFVMLTLGHLLTTGTEFLGIVALFARFGSLRGWSLAEISLFYGVVGTSFALAEGLGRGFDTFDNQVKSGDFDRLLLRPRSTAFQVAAQEVQLMRVGRLLQSLAVLIWAVRALPIVWTLAKSLLLVGSIVGGACLFYGLFVLQATLAFWTVESLEIMNTVTYGGTETAQFPLTIYRPWFRRFFTFVVPLACMNLLPMRAILPRADLQGIPLPLAWTAPLIGVLFLLIALQVWKLGVSRYCSAGS